MFETSVDPEKYLYHCTRHAVALEYVLPTLKLKMGIFADMSDPKESKTWMFSMSFSNKPNAQVYFLTMQKEIEKAIEGTCKVLCFTRDDPATLQDNLHSEYGRGYAHPRMCAQYGGNHKGVCFMLEREKLSKSVSRLLSGKNLLYKGLVIY